MLEINIQSRGPNVKDQYLIMETKWLRSIFYQVDRIQEINIFRMPEINILISLTEHQRLVFLKCWKLNIQLSAPNTRDQYAIKGAKWGIFDDEANELTCDIVNLSSSQPHYCVHILVYYPSESHELPYPPRYQLNNSTPFLLEG